MAYKYKYDFLRTWMEANGKTSKDILTAIGTQDYKRVKVGISNDKRFDTKDYVLGRFSSSDMDVLNPILDKMPDIFNDFLSISFEMLMKKYN